MHLNFYHCHGAELERFLVLSNVGKISNNKTQFHEKILEIGIDRDILFFLLFFSVSQLLLENNALLRKFRVSCLFKIFNVNIILFSFVDFLHAFATIDKIEYQ